MLDVLDAISKLLKQPWNHDGATDPADVGSIYYADSAARWEITYIQSKQFIWIIGRHPIESGHPILDVQLRCSSVRESEIVSIGNEAVTVMGKVVVLYSPVLADRRSETWLYLWNDGQLEINVCLAG